MNLRFCRITPNFWTSPPRSQSLPPTFFSIWNNDVSSDGEKNSFSPRNSSIHNVKFQLLGWMITRPFMKSLVWTIDFRFKLPMLWPCFCFEGHSFFACLVCPKDQQCKVLSTSAFAKPATATGTLLDSLESTSKDTKLVVSWWHKAQSHYSTMANAPANVVCPS